MLSLGAMGAQLGTALLVSEECPIHENYNRALIKARDTGTTVTGRSKGAPVRLLKNAMTRKYLELEKSDTTRDELERLTLGSLRRAVRDGDEERGSFMAGQVAGQLTEIRPIKLILAEIVQGFEATKESLCEERP
jgi:enoyl-[acyl-carrier protein] reductase II